MNVKLPSPLVYIIILTWNHWELTFRCLSSVLRITYPNYQVVIVDNGSRDGTVDFIREKFPMIKIIANSCNLGFAAGCNVGIQYAASKGADYVLLLNNDTLVAPDFLDKMIAHAQVLPKAGILAPKIVYADGSGRLWFAGGHCHPLTLDVVSLGLSTSNNEPQPVDYVFGTAMLIRKNVLEEIGLFDELFFMYYEDMDFCLRARKAGYKIYYVPAAVVYHHVAASTAMFLPARYYHKARSSVLFFRKHVSGARYLIIVPYRLGSAMHTLIRLIRQQQVNAAKAYLQGLKDGLKGKGGCHEKIYFSE